MRNPAKRLPEWRRRRTARTEAVTASRYPTAGTRASAATTSPASPTSAAVPPRVPPRVSAPRTTGAEPTPPARPTTTKFVVALAGKYEVPKGAPAGKVTATITISGRKVCWAFTRLTGISHETAAHIHKGAAGKAGPIVLPLDGAFKFKGCTTT